MTAAERARVRQAADRLAYFGLSYGITKTGHLIAIVNGEPRKLSTDSIGADPMESFEESLRMLLQEKRPSREVA